MSQVDPKETRSAAMQKQYEEIEESGVCPFCKDHFHKIHQSPVIVQNNHWLATNNDHPYANVKHHFLLVYCGPGHIISPNEMSDQAKIDFFDIVSRMNERFNIDSGAVVMRYGGPGNGSSVRHLHAHIIVGKSTAKTDVKIKVKVGYS